MAQACFFSSEFLETWISLFDAAELYTRGLQHTGSMLQWAESQDLPNFNPNFAI